MSRWKPEKVTESCPHPELRTSRTGSFIVPRVDYCPRCHLWVTSTAFDLQEENEKVERRLRGRDSVECPGVERAPLDLRGWKLLVGGKPSSPVKIARQILQNAFTDLHGRPLEETRNPRSPGNLLVVGEPTSGALLRDLSTRIPDLDPRRLGFDGYLIKHLARALGLENEILVLAGENPRAAIYAAFHLEELLRSGSVHRGLEVRERPVFQFRGGNSEGAFNTHSVEITITDCRPTEQELLGLMRRRVNLVLLRFTLWQNRWVRFKYLPEVKKVPEEIDAAIAELKEDLERVKRFGLLAFIQKSLPQNSWADPQFFAAHPSARARVRGPRPFYSTFPRFCPSHPFFKRYLEAELRELYELYPELDGIWTFHGYDGGALACDCKSCKGYPYSKRLVDMHRVTHDALRRASPGARYFLDHSGVDFYAQALVSQLPEDIHYTSWGRFPCGYAWPFLKIEDSLVDISPRYIAQLSTQSEGLVGPNFPLVDLPALAADIDQYARRATVGLIDHHALGGGYMGDPERYFDPAEPQHEAFLAWGWNPRESSPAEFLRGWARKRFPRAAGNVARAYTELARVKDRTMPWLTLRAGFSAPIFAPLDWTLLEPELKMEASFVAYPDGPLLGRENPYGYPPKGDQYYVYDRELRKTPISARTIPRWLERFDATDHTQKALDELTRASARDPDNWHLARLCLFAQGWHALARAYRDYIRAGLKVKAAGRGVSKNGKKRSRGDWLASIVSAYRASLEQLVAPFSTTLLWSRWFQKMFRLEWTFVLRKMLRENGLPDSPFDAFSRDKPAVDISGSELVLGWWGEAKSTSVDRRRWRTLDLKGAANLSRTDAITDFPDWFTDDPHVPKKNPPHRLKNVPAGLHRFFGVPFDLRKSGKAFVLLDGSTPDACELPLDAAQLAGCVQGIHFLLAGLGRAQPLEEVARLRVTFGDRERGEFPLRYWQEVTSYKFPETTPASGVAWLEIDENYSGHFTGQVMGFNHYCWKNPEPSRGLKKMEIVSTKGPVRLLVLGMTMELDAVEKTS